MSTVDIVLDPRRLIAACDVLDSQLPYATMKALNQLGTEFQLGERNTLVRGMIIRRPWVLQGIKIDRGDFATKDNLRTRVHVDDTRSFLDKFDAGGTRTPLNSASLAVPIAARANAEAVIPNSLRPKALGFREVGGRSIAIHAKGLSRRLKSAVLSGDLKVYEGARRTILIQNADGSGVILQRVGRGSRHNGDRDSNLKLLYRLKPRTPVPALLYWERTVNEALLKWPSMFAFQYEQALRTANIR
jgi:hypothetical protein